MRNFTRIYSSVDLATLFKWSLSNLKIVRAPLRGQILVCIQILFVMSFNHFGIVHMKVGIISLTKYEA